MLPLEPIPTAVLLAVLGLLLAASAAVSRVSRFGVPVVMLFLVIGMLAGSEGLGRIPFEDYHLTFRVGIVALVLILFDGGLNTRVGALRAVAGPAALLATVGVAATALGVAACARALGFGWTEALLLGAIVSSTDAAAVFALLRGQGLRLPRRMGVTLEAESGLNDPMAVILTIELTRVLLGDSGPVLASLGAVVWQLAAGTALGVGVGAAGRLLLGRVRPIAGGLYPAFTLAIAFLAFGVTTLVGASGFLAVYVAGVVVGRGPIPHASTLLRVHDALAWLSQIVMFLALGLLSFPSRLVAVAPVGIALAVALAVIVRPAVILALLAPFRFRLAERVTIGWLGLRGAVPIILGAYPVLAGVPGAERLFDVVFFVVVLSVVLQGGTARWVAGRLGFAQPVEAPPRAVLEMNSTRPLHGELLSFHIRGEAAVTGTPADEIPFPPGAGAVLVVRGDDLLVPRDVGPLGPGDHVYVFCRPEDRAELQLLFGQLED
jgi:cell volume regulation protein A